VLRHGSSLSREEDSNSPNSAGISAETATRMAKAGMSVEPSSDPEVRLAQAWAEEARLHNDLRAAGLM